MFLKQLICLLAIASVTFGASANASDIDVRAGNVRITTDRDGDTNVYTRSRWHRYPYRSYSNWSRYYRTRNKVRCSRGSNVVRQETTQISRSGSTVTRSRTTYCR
jgi:hypothetical protein